MVLSNCILQQCTKNLQTTSIRESAPCHSEGPGESEILEIRIVHIFWQQSIVKAGVFWCKIIQLVPRIPEKFPPIPSNSHIISHFFREKRPLSCWNKNTDFWDLRHRKSIGISEKFATEATEAPCAPHLKAAVRSSQIQWGSPPGAPAQAAPGRSCDKKKLMAMTADEEKTRVQHAMIL